MVKNILKVFAEKKVNLIPCLRDKNNVYGGFSMFADLHTHSHFSDGTDSPKELISLAKAKGVKALSLVDHDTVLGVEEFLREGEKQGMQAVPGVEISTSVQGARIHILGYGIDFSHPLLLAFLSNLSKARTENTRMSLALLKELDLLDYPWERVLHHHPGRNWIHSSHVFRAMMKDGYYTGWDQWLPFYYQYFGKNSPAYLDIDEFTPEEAIQVILKADGIPVLAHPKLIGDDSKIFDLKEKGLKGLEVFYPAHDIADIRRYSTIAGQLGLVMTGGTDWHGKGTEWPVEMGEYGMAEEMLGKLGLKQKGKE